MKFFEKLIAARNYPDKKSLEKVSHFILEVMEDQGIRYIDEDFEKVADNHIIELSVRLLDGKMLQDSDNPYDHRQISHEAMRKAERVKEGIKKRYDVELTGIETFLLATHFMLNA